jgi:5'-nucleotidase
MRILVDMDGVIADFEHGFLEDWRATYPDKFYIPFEERNTFQLTDQYPEDLKALVGQIYCEPGFFRKLNPIAGGIEALWEMDRLGLEVFICTSPLKIYQNCVIEKYIWVEENLGVAWTKRLVMTRDKTLVRGDILIDDKPVIEGADVPAWEHVLYDQPYNRTAEVSHKRRLTWANWKEVLWEVNSVAGHAQSQKD